MNGVIWNKIQKTFVPISSVPVYAMMQQKRLRQSRELETHNFQLQYLTLTSFTESNFFEFYDNNTKVTGFCGDVWTLLSQVLNFTLQPVKSNINNIGTVNNHINQSGLMDIIVRNETDAIPKLVASNSTLPYVDFTLPLWTSGSQLYIRHERIHDKMWMTKVFSWKIWCILFTMYILFSMLSFWSQTILTRIRNKNEDTTFSEHFFYNFGMLCNQSYIPDVLSGRSKILEISLGFFCSILIMAYGAVLLIYMSKQIFVPPFNDLITLLYNNKYSIVVLNGTNEDMIFKIASNFSQLSAFLIAKETGRYVNASTITEMNKLACSTQEKKYVLYQSEEQYYIMKEQEICHLISPGEVFFKKWITSGLTKNFKYKRSIDLGILKLIETGMLNIIKRHWLTLKMNENINMMEAINMDQILLMISIMGCGVIASLVILIIEKVIYIYKLRLIKYSFFN